MLKFRPDIRVCARVSINSAVTLSLLSGADVSGQEQWMTELIATYFLMSSMVAISGRMVQKLRTRQIDHPDQIDPYERRVANHVSRTIGASFRMTVASRTDTSAGTSTWTSGSDMILDNGCGSIRDTHAGHAWVRSLTWVCRSCCRLRSPCSRGYA